MNESHWILRRYKYCYGHVIWSALKLGPVVQRRYASMLGDDTFWIIKQRRWRMCVCATIRKVSLLLSTCPTPPHLPKHSSFTATLLLGPPIKSLVSMSYACVVVQVNLCLNWALTLLDVATWFNSWVSVVAIRSNRYANSFHDPKPSWMTDMSLVIDARTIGDKVR